MNRVLVEFVRLRKGTGVGFLLEDSLKQLKLPPPHPALTREWNALSSVTKTKTEVGDIHPFFIRTSTLFEKATLRTKMFLTFLKRLFGS